MKLIGRFAARTIVALPADERPIGVFTLNDLLAIGLLQGLDEISG